MAKLTRNSYKRKVILFGVLIFMSIALISTGFAAWVMSTNANQNQEGNVTVGQVTEGKLKITELTLSNDSFIFEPKEADTSGRVRWDEVVDEKGKAVNAESLEITVTGKVSPTKYLGSLAVKLELPAGVSDAITAGYIKLDDVTLISENGKSLTFDKNKNEYEFSVEIKFTWGDKFNNLNPGEYYDTDPEGMKVSDEEVKKTLEDLRATIYGYFNQLPVATDDATQAQRDAMIKEHENDTLKFKVIVTAKAN